MPSDANAALYKRLMETGNQVQVALDENADAQVFLALLEQHQGVMAELKQVKIENDPEMLVLIQKATQEVGEVMEQIRIQRDGLAGQIMQSKSKKRAFDVYHKI